MNEKIYFWLTIASLFLTIIIFLRKSSVADIVSCALTATFYACGLFGSIYEAMYETTDSFVVLDALYLLVVVSVIYATWLVPEILVRLIFERHRFKELQYLTGEKLMTWIAVYIGIIFFEMLYENSAVLICAIALTVIVAAKLVMEIAKDMPPEDTDDYFSVVLALVIPCFFVSWLFCSLIGNEQIVDALGVGVDYHYTISVSLLPLIMLFLPVIFGIASIDINRLFKLSTDK